MKPLAIFWLALTLGLEAALAAVGNTDWFDATRAGDTEKVKALLQADPKLVEARTEDGSAALHLAALEGHVEITRLLLANQAPVNARGLREETPLHMAMYGGHRDVAELLLASQADIDAQNSAGETPLHLAARKGYRELVVLLLSQKADLGVTDKSGRNPKASAAENGHWDVVELLTPRVGDLHDLKRVVFEGNNTFPAEALRQGLKDTLDFFEISHPLAPLDTYLEALEQKLLRGYQHTGFPEAHIEVRHDSKADRIVVKVAEGPRYMCGEVKVTGATNVPVAEIIEPLIPSPVLTLSVQRAFVFLDKAPATNPLTEDVEEESEPPEAAWVKGEPAPFSNVDLKQMTAQVTEVLRDHGFLFPKANLSVVPDKTTRTAKLLVEILKEGSRGVVGQIEVTGNKRNSTEAVLSYLDVKPGMPLPSQLVARIEDRLWRSARFLTYKVSLGSPEAEGRVSLTIAVAEYNEAPPLNQALSRTEETMLKLRDWLSKLNESQEDVIVGLSGFPAPAPAGEFVLSPRRGLALLARDAAQQIAPQDDYAVVLKGGLAGFYSSVGGRKLLIPCPKSQLKVFVKMTSKAAGTDGGPFNLTAGAGFTQLKEKGPASSPYRFELALPPVVCMGLAHRWDCASWFDGDVLIRSNATLLVKLDSRTGRITEFQASGGKGHETIQVRFEPGAFDHVLERLEVRTANLMNISDSNAPLSSAAAFLFEEAMSSKYLEPLLRTMMPAETAARLPGLLRQLKLGEVLEPLNQLLAKPAESAGQVDFTIPIDLELGEATRSDLIGLAVGWLLRRSDDLFPAGSWPWTLLREVSLTFQGKGRYTDQALTGIYESNETGPLGCLAVARVLSRLQPTLGQKFAARGLERLSTADFRRDYRLFLAGDSISSQCCQRLAATLRTMDEEQAAALAKLQSPARGEFVLDCARRLRTAKDEPILEALTPALDHYWETELKDQVARSLRTESINVEEVFKEALALHQASSAEKEKEAKLFQIAAELGHPGAQYYLGMSYETGAGVPKDVAAAVNWYRQSATNGYVDASMALGNFYSEGLEVKPDYVEAFVWYSVAAAQGNRLAKLFRNGMMSKLNSEQVAEAEQRVAAIPIRRSPDANAVEPASSGKDH